MKYLLTYESYLSGGKPPLYHYIDSSESFRNILKTDKLKPSKTAGKEQSEVAICLSRNNDYEEYEGGSRLVLDQNLLRKNGINPKPIDEVQFIAKGRGKNSPHKKSNFKDTISTGKRYTRNGIDLPKTGLELEFEERIYKTIKNIGKYIIYIDINSDVVPDYILEYLNKYPKIKVRNKEGNQSNPKEIDLVKINQAKNQ